MVSACLISTLLTLTILSLAVLQVEAENFGSVSCEKGIGWVPSITVLAKFTLFCPISLPVSDTKLACTFKCALKKLNGLDGNGNLALDKVLPDLLLSFPKDKQDSVKTMISKCNKEHGKSIKAEKDEPKGDKCASYKKLFKCFEQWYNTSCKK